LNVVRTRVLVISTWLVTLATLVALVAGITAVLAVALVALVASVSLVALVTAVTGVALVAAVSLVAWGVALSLTAVAALLGKLGSERADGGIELPASVPVSRQAVSMNLESCVLHRLEACERTVVVLQEQLGLHLRSVELSTDQDARVWHSGVRRTAFNGKLLTDTVHQISRGKQISILRGRTHEEVITHYLNGGIVFVTMGCDRLSTERLHACDGTLCVLDCKQNAHVDWHRSHCRYAVLRMVNFDHTVRELEEVHPRREHPSRPAVSGCGRVSSGGCGGRVFAGSIVSAKPRNDVLATEVSKSKR
jgi:hypothetical protein